jgi:hypothetical protein
LVLRLDVPLPKSLCAAEQADKAGHAAEEMAAKPGDKAAEKEPSESAGAPKAAGEPAAK